MDKIDNMDRIMNRVYVSCPMTEPKTKLDKTIAYLGSLNFSIRFWNRNTPYDKDQTDIKNCDIFCIILPNNDFSYSIDKLPTGTQSELKLAVSLGKKIVLAYTTMSGELGIYDTDTIIEKDFIKGLPGTRRNIENFVNALSTILEHKVDNVNITNPCVERPFTIDVRQSFNDEPNIITLYDRRLLL